MYRYQPNNRFLAVAVLGLLLLTGCTSMGSRTIPRDSFNYNEAIAQSRNQQMLLNIVRLRYLDIPDFLAVGSVIASYSYDGDVGIARTRTDDTSSVVPDTLTGRANLAYSESPTITYAPLAGEEFSRRLLKPIPVEIIFSLGQAGWPVDILLTITLQRINDVQNMGFGQVPSPGDVDTDSQFMEEARKLEQYQRTLELLLILSREGAVEVHHKKGDESKLPYLHFAKNTSPRTSALIDELKHTLNLDPTLTTFRVTGRTTGRDKNEITIQSRSLLSIMSFLSRGIDVPEQDQADGRVVAIPPAALKEMLKRVPLRILSSKTRPPDPYVAVKYRNDWFYIDGADIRSKRTFATMLVLFNLAAPAGSTAAPLLTLPTGR
jgi:uncharacterized protein YceK